MFSQPCVREKKKVSTLCEASVQGSDACGLHQYLKGTAAAVC